MTSLTQSGPIQIGAIRRLAMQRANPQRNDPGVATRLAPVAIESAATTNRADQGQAVATSGARSGATGRRDGQSGATRRSTWPMERVVQQLNLTTEQQAKADKVLEAHHEKIRALFRKAQADVLMQMKEVLTDEQFQQFTKALENGPPGFRRRDRSENGARPERATPNPIRLRFLPETSRSRDCQKPTPISKSIGTLTASSFS